MAGELRADGAISFAFALAVCRQPCEDDTTCIVSALRMIPLMAAAAAHAHADAGSLRLLPSPPHHRAQGTLSTGKVISFDLDYTSSLMRFGLVMTADNSSQVI